MRELCNKIVNIEFEKIFDIWIDTCIYPDVYFK